MSVLKLSSIWRMTQVCRMLVLLDARPLIDQIRKCAIRKLSADIGLLPLDKILLARAYQVSTWLQQGIMGLVLLYDPNPMLKELDLETAAQIKKIREVLRDPSTPLYFKRQDIKCGYCSTSRALINGTPNCNHCGHAVHIDSKLTVSNPVLLSSNGDRLVTFGAIKCPRGCRKACFSPKSNPTCNSCQRETTFISKVRIKPERTLKELIMEAFSEEIKDYQYF